MNQVWSIVVIVVCWIISFVEPSGWSSLFSLEEKVNVIIIVSSILVFLRKPIQNHSIFKDMWSNWLIFAVITCFLVIPFLVSGTTQSWSYSIAFLVVYIISHCTITYKVIKITSIIYSIAGLTIMAIYLYGDILSGWNDNAIAIVGLFSFLYFTIYLNTLRGSDRFWLWNTISVVYLYFLFSTYSRSSMIFSALAVLAIMWRSVSEKILRSHKNRIFLLNIPLVIFILTLIIASTPIFEELNMWSMMEYDKPIFNGREIIWDESYKLLKQSDYFGTGEFRLNYHNSAVAAISVFGVLGYITWIRYFSNTLSFISRWIKDPIVFGSIFGFIMIFLQQSVELGFISNHPNLIPYTILGVAIARIKTIDAYY